MENQNSRYLYMGVLHYWFKPLGAIHLNPLVQMHVGNIDLMLRYLGCPHWSSISLEGIYIYLIECYYKMVIPNWFY